MKKVIIIGAGDIGERAFRFIGSEYVAYFADNFKAGSLYNDKLVLPVTKLPEYEADYVFLLAVSNHLQEIKHQLKELKIDYYYFNEEVYYGNAIYKADMTAYQKMTISECIEKYNLDAAYIVTTPNDQMSSFISEITDIPVCNACDNINSFQKIILSDEEYISGKYDKCINSIYRIIFVGNEHDRDNRLSRFKNIHKGKRCFLIGNGPSLRTEDLDKIYYNNDFSIGLNVIHKLYGKTDWRPSYICISDMLVIMQNYYNIINKNKCTIFISDFKNIIDRTIHENEYLFHEIHESKDAMLTPGFISDITKGVYNGSTVSYIALQICAYMGFSEVYLLGMDCSNWGSHFSNDYWRKDEVFNGPNEKRIFMAYIEAKKAFKERNIRILNATRGGKLEVFERVDFDSLFKE